MDPVNVEAIVEKALEAVHAHYVLPLSLALGTLTAVASLDPKVAPEVARLLRSQADSCPEWVRGRVMLQGLAELAGATTPADDPSGTLRARLRLIRGGPDKPGN